jgi:hypothetical protein
VKIIVDHVNGSRRGQRQEFASDARVRIGRHPDNEVSFDAHRDLDASSRHAEIRAEADRWVLVDVGSSNGTFVEGKRVTELSLAPGVPLVVEFGSGGPQLQVFVGDELPESALPPVEPKRSGGRWMVLAIGGVVAIGVAVGLAVALMR